MPWHGDSGESYLVSDQSRDIWQCQQSVMFVVGVYAFLTEVLSFHAGLLAASCFWI